MGRRYLEILKEVVEAAKRELSIEERAAAYVLLKELLFWYEIKKVAQDRIDGVLRCLPREVVERLREELDR